MSILILKKHNNNKTNLVFGVLFLKKHSRMPIEYIVESDVIIRAVDKPFPDRQFMGCFPTAEMAYAYVEKYLSDTKDLHTYFTRQFLSSNTELEERIKESRIIAINVVLGQFEDMIYIRKDESK
jgi:hypothetical protein